MKLLQSKNGMSLTMILGIVVFVIGTVSTLFIIATERAKLVDTDIHYSEEYANARERVEAALHIIARDQNLDRPYLDDLERYLGVTISPYNDWVWSVSSPISGDQIITSYITGTAATQSTFDLLFSFTGTEPDFQLSPLITPTTMLGAYLTDFMEATFAISPEVPFTDFDSIVSYVSDLETTHPGTYQHHSSSELTSQKNPTVSGNWFITGSVNMPKGKNLTVSPGFLLFIDGSLTMSSGTTITGNVVVNHNLTLNGSRNSLERIRGTVYVQGDVLIKKTTLGITNRPAFIFAEGTVEITGNVNGTGYILADSLATDHIQISITGGIYTPETLILPSGSVSENANLDPTLLYNYGVAESIIAESGEAVVFRYTFPKIE